MHSRLGRQAARVKTPEVWRFFKFLTSAGNNGRSDRIRTYDPLVPNEVRYQTALHSDCAAKASTRAL